ncbi:MAG: sulfite exporter TauE/SafE family protein [Chloroflexota bacterium]|nr:sulfite exporter TauE/SafE family protein [Chloroflexota bacterium]
MWTATALALGFVAGTLGGMLGIGGSIITIPGMILLLGIEQHVAQGVALSAMLVTALVGTSIHFQQRNVEWNIVVWIVPSAVAFTFIGSWVAGVIPTEWLSKIFATFLLIIGITMVVFNRGGHGVNTS